MKLNRQRLAQRLPQTPLEGHPVIVVILTAAVLILFVISLLSSFASTHRKRS